MYAKSYSFIIPMINLCLVDSLVGGGLNIINRFYRAFFGCVVYAKSYSFIIPMINLCLVDSLVGGGLNIINRF